MQNDALDDERDEGVEKEDGDENPGTAHCPMNGWQYRVRNLFDFAGESPLSDDRPRSPNTPKGAEGPRIRLGKYLGDRSAASGQKPALSPRIRLDPCPF